MFKRKSVAEPRTEQTSAEVQASSLFTAVEQVQPQHRLEGEGEACGTPCSGLGFLHCTRWPGYASLPPPGQHLPGDLPL